jgi:UDP-glucose 4-epimerase
MARILLTGATGFIGKNLVEKLSRAGYQFNGVSKSGGMLNGTLINALDCTDQEALNRYCEDKSFDGIIHLAASLSSSFYDETARLSVVQNVKMTMNLLEVFRKQSGGVFIYASSTSVYGYPERLPVTEETPAKPNGFYPLGKFFGELLCQQYQKEHNLCIAILRISAPYGPGMRRETVIDKFIRQALLSEAITLYGTGSRSQDFTYIEDVVNAIALAYEAKATGIFNISSGTSTSMKQLAEIVLSILPKSKSKVIYSGTDDPQEDYHAAFSFEKARKTFNYQPSFSLEEGLQRCAEAIREELRL